LTAVPDTLDAATRKLIAMAAEAARSLETAH
jgi:hypothetical protein